MVDLGILCIGLWQIVQVNTSSLGKALEGIAEFTVYCLGLLTIPLTPTRRVPLDYSRNLCQSWITLLVLNILRKIFSLLHGIALLPLIIFPSTVGTISFWVLLRVVKHL